MLAAPSLLRVAWCSLQVRSIAKYGHLMSQLEKSYGRFNCPHLDQHHQLLI